MNLDLILTLIILLLTVIGVFRGFVAEFFSIFGFILSVILAKILMVHVMHFLHLEKIYSSQSVVLYCVVFLVVYCLLAILAKFLRVIIKIVMLGWLDRVLGGIFGFIKGILLVLLICLVLMAIANHNNSCQKLTKNSFYIKGILPRITIITGFLPKNIAEEVTQYRNSLALNGLINGLEKLYQNIMTPSGSSTTDSSLDN